MPEVNFAVSITKVEFKNVQRVQDGQSKVGESDRRVKNSMGFFLVRVSQYFLVHCISTIKTSCYYILDVVVSEIMGGTGMRAGVEVGIDWISAFGYVRRSKNIGIWEIVLPHPSVLYFACKNFLPNPPVSYQCLRCIWKISSLLELSYIQNIDSHGVTVTYVIETCWHNLKLLEGFLALVLQAATF